MHFKVARRILQYLKANLTYGLPYKKTRREHNFTLSGFTNAYWDGDPLSSCSTVGYFTSLAAILLCNKKKLIVALSSIETKYNAITSATQECLWLRSLINDIYQLVDKPTELCCDNLSFVILVSCPIFHARAKHIGSRRFCKNRLILLRWKEQIVDIFTRALSKPKFYQFIAVCV